MVALPSGRFNPRVELRTGREGRRGDCLGAAVPDLESETTNSRGSHASDSFPPRSAYFTSPQSGPRYFPLMVMLRLMVWVPLVVAIFIAPLKALPPESDSTLI